ADAIQERFGEWLWSHPERATRLQVEYNRRFNAVVLRDYQAEGDRLTLPGLAKNFTPRPHQKAAIARMIHEPAVGLFHQVGAGKTAEMVIGATELKRLGMITKPVIVVPNHMLEQITREWLQLYPQALLLAASTDDLPADRRRQFVARAATNDWDGIIMTRGAFQSLPMQAATVEAYVTREMDAVRQQLEAAKSKDGGTERTVKQLEKAILRQEQSLQRTLGGATDPGISFEQTGIDYVIVDELHDYKNLRVVSNIAGAAITGSQRASDLHMKVDYLRRTHGHRVMTGATATPIANSVSEMYVMSRYLAPDDLVEAGIVNFDAWALTFGEVVTGMELNVVGDKFKVTQRFARFNNVPELLGMFNRFADVKTAADLQLPVPPIAARADGQRVPDMLIVPRSPALADYISRLSERVDLIATRGVDPSEDNMLKVAGDGRRAALDLRLVYPQMVHDSLDVPITKVQMAADRLADVWQATKDREYVDPATGEPSPIRGALQLVFCDLSTPSDGWNVYDELREALHERGLPPGSVRFIHEARNDAEKARLFQACRSGHVAVLVGSTAKMGVGTNVQDRAVHLLNMDAPWRPADIEQRHGRIIRQGNLNPEVMLTQVVTEGSFDTYMWQTLERKARFIDQVMTRRVDTRDIEDVSADVLSFTEFKAITSGQPLLLEVATAQQELARYQRLHTAWRRNEQSLQDTIRYGTEQLASIGTAIGNYEQAITRTTPTRGEAFSITLNGRFLTNRTDAAMALQRILADRKARPYYAGRAGAEQIGSIAGHQITLEVGTQRAVLAIGGLDSSSSFTLKVAEMDDKPSGTITRLENLPENMPRHLVALKVLLQDVEHRVEAAHGSLGQPFKHAAALTTAQQRYQEASDALAESQRRARRLPPGTLR
ncbi:MAG TPA: helicase-related protein, partial [Propionibacteriaceae bacterium]|nr:helicase-related protein [Propionibacteriaceae bacterium]